MAFLDKKELLKLHLPFQIFTVGYILAIFIPKVVREGMFSDGLTYSSIARNMALGKGSFWEPYFSSSFWLPYNTGLVFYEHPPLMMGLQSLFFRVLGDHWFIEKLYCAIILVITLFLIVRLWKIVCGNDVKASSFSWLVLLLFCTMPKVIWAYPNNMLDSTMAVFCLASVYFSLKALHLDRTPSLNLSLSGLFVLCAFLTKGPVGLFPLAVPFLYFIVYSRNSLSKLLLYQSILLTAFILLFCLLLLHAPAKNFIWHYFSQQVVNAVAGRREEVDVTWMSHFNILYKLLLQLIPSLALGALLTIVLRIKKARFTAESKYNLAAIFFLLVGLSGSVPIIISPKQSSFYLIPCLPYFSLALVLFVIPTLKQAMQQYRISRSVSLWLNNLLRFAIAVVIVYSFSLIGKARRDEEVIRDLQQISRIVPVGSKVGTFEETIKDFTTQTYFQRYHQLELSTDTTLNFFIIDTYKSGNALLTPPNTGFTKATINTERYLLFLK